MISLISIKYAVINFLYGRAVYAVQQQSFSEESLALIKINKAFGAAKEQHQLS
jgi:hypothetical protein